MNKLYFYNEAGVLQEMQWKSFTKAPAITPHAILQSMADKKYKAVVMFVPTHLTTKEGDF